MILLLSVYMCWYDVTMLLFMLRYSLMLLLWYWRSWKWMKAYHSYDCYCSCLFSCWLSVIIIILMMMSTVFIVITFRDYYSCCCCCYVVIYTMMFIHSDVVLWRCFGTYCYHCCCDCCCCVVIRNYYYRCYVLLLLSCIVVTEVFCNLHLLILHCIVYWYTRYLLLWCDDVVTVVPCSCSL